MSGSGVVMTMNICRYGVTGAVYQQTFQLRTPLFWDLMNQIMKTRWNLSINRWWWLLQANMSPERALEGWLMLQEAYPERFIMIMMILRSFLSLWSWRSTYLKIIIRKIICSWSWTIMWTWDVTCRELVSPGTSLKPNGEMVWIDT